MRKLTLSSSLVVSCFLLSGSGLCAQGPSPSAGQYAAESFVIDRSDWLYSNNADGTGYREHTVAVTIQSEAALRTFGVVAVGFASASEHVELHYARARHKDGSVTETPVSGALEQPEEVTREAPFYSDLKQEQLPVKNLQVGDTLEWQARIVRTKAEAPNAFWGFESFIADDAVTLEESIELRVPAASEATVWTNPKLSKKPVETIEGDTKIYRWESAQLKPTAGPEAEAAKKAKKGKLLTPDEELDEEQGKRPSMAWTSFKSWEAVGAWYRGLEGERAAPDDEIKAKVAELTAGKTTEEDKVRAVYAYVSAQIRYIGVAFGVGRFQPHEAADVLHNQYGDCKDKATLLAAMLAALGLHADSVLIGDGVRWNEAVPSPAAFNHLITRVKVGEEEVWLDATQEVAPYKVLLFELRDKPALVIPDKGPATVESTPKNLPFPGVDAWKAVGTLDKDGISESHVTMTLRGDDEVLYRAIVHSVAPAQYDELMQRVMQAMGYSGTVSHTDLSRPEDTTGPFTLSFDYHREKAGDWDNLRTLPQVLPVQLPQVDEKDPPVQSIVLGTPHTEISNAEMKLPAGWGVELPEAVHEKAAFATYDMTYRFDKGTVYTERKLVILQRKVPASDWKIYKKWGDAIGLGLENYVQLKRVGGPRPEPPPAPVMISPPGNSSSESSDTDTNESASELIQKAFDALRKMDDTTAESLLKRAKAADPKARRLWAGYGTLAILRGMPREAIEDLQKEISSFPDEVEVYAPLATAQQMNRDEDGMIATLQKWTALDPENPQPQMALAGVLLQKKRYAEAAESAGKAVAILGPEEAAKNERLELLLGRAQLKAGMVDKGEATLVALLGVTSDPGITNDAAYELADAKLQLPLDDEKQRGVMDHMTAETQSWTLDESPSMLSQKSSLLVAAWDTMGWILFREGKLAEAKSYIQAAWLSRPNAELQSHLDQVNAALGIKTQPKPKPKLPPELPPSIVVDAETPGGQEARTVALGPSDGRSGVAEYRMLLAAGKAERVEASGEKTIRGAEEMIKAADFSKYFPANSNAKLVKHGMVNCYSGKCSLVLEP